MIPTIEELDRVGCAAAGWLHGGVINAELCTYLTAIRDAMVAACRPHLRPIAEMPNKVPEGCVRLYGGIYGRRWAMHADKSETDTHFVDIALPVEAYPADFEQAFAESKLDAKDKGAAFKLWKGGKR